VEDEYMKDGECVGEDDEAALSGKESPPTKRSRWVAWSRGMKMPINLGTL
jgi:hypothetical protein